MLRRRVAAVFALLSIALCVGTPATAQTVTGTLSGTVTDASGAVIPGIQVTAKNTETGLARAATTNDEGYYLMSFLPLGAYDVTVNAQGFQKVVKTGVVVELN